MVNAKGGFAYIDMSVYGAFAGSPISFNPRIGDVDKKLRQKDKPIVLVGLHISNGEGEEDTILPAVVMAFDENNDVFTAMTFVGNNTLAVGFALSNNEIMITYGS